MSTPDILIIVESPSKAKAVAKYARNIFPGKSVLVRASLGHIRDLPLDEIGIDIERGFQPQYIIPKKRTKTVQTLRPLIRKARRVILASDPDREGEAIAWHILEVFANELKGKRVERTAFNAVTRESVQQALKNPQQLNMRLVKAAIARRVMDRLIGYVISPRLWAAVQGRNLSAGRVQTVALRLLIEQADHLAAKGDAWTVEVEL
jgi:DNA topoisomerase I